LVTALGIVVFSMALLLTGSMWAVFAVLLLIGLVAASILAVVGVLDEREKDPLLVADVILEAVSELVQGRTQAVGAVAGDQRACGSIAWLAWKRPSGSTRALIAASRP
jgi:hypothetical protein